MLRYRTTAPSMSCRKPAFICVAVLTCNVFVDLVAAETPDTTDDCGVADYTTLLSIKTAGTSKIASTAPLDQQSTIPGVVFIKMIKVAGELFSSTLAQYALKRGWRTLQHKNCNEIVNPLGQATCMCNEHYIGPGDEPSPPNEEHRYAALYTHMHYNPSLLKNYMVPGAVKLVILRHPLAVLRSTHAMAAYQAVHESNIKDDFCQDLAADGDAWRAKCARMHNGLDSLLDYLDHDANTRLTELFARQPKDLHEQAMAITNKASLLLEDFVVGVQEEFDGSMLLFEHALKWSREDSLYVNHDVNSHQLSKKTTSKAALASWGIGTSREDEIINKLRLGPYRYHEILYERGLALHKKQMRETIGTKADIDSAVQSYRAQKDTFTTCMHRTLLALPTTYKNLLPNVCTHFGLQRYAEARPHCAKTAIDAASS